MLLNDPEYFKVFEDIKQRIIGARSRAVMAANTSLIFLHWEVGVLINNHKQWGNKFIQNLARDIRRAFPQSKGFSYRNLKYMSQFAATYPDLPIGQQPVAQLPWGHNISLMAKVKDNTERMWYAVQALEHGWSHAVLDIQIDTHAYRRQVTAEKVTNFEARLPPPQSDMAVQALKDPYIFDFVDADSDMAERHIENALVRDVTALLLELGTGFAFVGQQYHLVVGDDDFFIDLLFYHIPLRCYFVIELKAGEFKPEHVGQINFYVAAIDGELKGAADNPTIGLLLVKSKNNLVVEYALGGITSPIGVSEYRLVRELPEEYRNLLPSANDIMTRIGMLENSDDEKLSQ